MGEYFVNDVPVEEAELLSDEDFRLLSHLGLNPPRRKPARTGKPQTRACSWKAIVKRPESEIPVEFRKSVILRRHKEVADGLLTVPSGVLDRRLHANVVIPRPRQPGAWPSNITYEPITISELEVGSSHRGRVLYGTLCAEPLKVSCVRSAVEDQAGYVVEVQIFGSTYRFPRGLRVAIKEPFLHMGLNGKLDIQVGDASSIETMRELPTPPTPELEPLNKLRLQGNMFFSLGSWNQAIGLYTDCIKGCQTFLAAHSDQKIRKEVLVPALSNRAGAYLKVGKFERALVDSNLALRISPDHLKSLYCKGSALVGLQEFDRATFWLRKSLAAGAGDSDIEVAIEMSKACTEEGDTGVYNKISEFITKGRVPPRCSDFVGPVKLRPVPAYSSGRQVTLFASRDVTRGELLLVNEAIAMLHGSDDTAFWVSLPSMPMKAERDDLVDLVSSKLAESRRAVAQLRMLTLGVDHAADLNVFRSNWGHVPEDIIEMAEVDPREFNHRAVTKLVEKHGFEAWMPYMVSNAGLWVLPSLLTHSCISNTSLFQVGASMFVHAARDIRENEKLTVAYCDTLLPLHRRQQLYEGWGFNCNCQRCTLEQSLQAQLAPLNKLFDQSFGEQFELASIGLEVEKRLLLLSSSLKPDAKSWVRVAYVLVFIAEIQSARHLTSVRNRSMSVEEILQLVQAVVPGHVRSLALLSCQVVALMRYGTKEQTKLIDRADVRDVFRSSLGYQDPEAIMHVASLCSKMF